MKKDNLDRRSFLKRLGLGVSAAGITLVGCDSAGKKISSTGSQNSKIPGEMTYRVTPSTGDKVSLLGYGCMRWPLMQDPHGEEGAEIVDQEAVNKLVDYALAHGVNYFDTAPPYVRGMSEEATGNALCRHPRDSYYIATKMSNQHLAKNGLKGKELFDASVEMYHN